MRSAYGNRKNSGGCVGAALAVCSALLLAIPCASAQSSITDLSVAGAIVPAACQPSFSTGSSIDFGDMFMGELSTGITELRAADTMFSVACNGPTRFALRFSDNRDPIPGALLGINTLDHYGIGYTNQGELFGGILLRTAVSTAKLDGMPGYFTGSDDGGRAWQTSRDSGLDWHFRPSRLHGFTATSGVSTGPTAASSVEVPISVVLRVLGKGDFTTSDEIAVDASITVDVVYL